MLYFSSVNSCRRADISCRHAWKRFHPRLAKNFIYRLQPECFDFRPEKLSITKGKIKSTKISRPRMLSVPLCSPSLLPLKQAGALFAFWSHSPHRIVPQTLLDPRLDAVPRSFWASDSLSPRPVAHLRSLRLVPSLQFSIATAPCASAHFMVCSRPEAFYDHGPMCIGVGGSLTNTVLY